MAGLRKHIEQHLDEVREAGVINEAVNQVASPRLPFRAMVCHRSTPLRTKDGSAQFKHNYFAEMCSGSEEGSYLRLIDLCITQL